MIVLSVAMGKPRRVLYFQAEVSARSLQDRLKKLLAAFPSDEKLVRANRSPYPTRICASTSSKKSSNAFRNCYTRHRQRRLKCITIGKARRKA